MNPIILDDNATYFRINRAVDNAILLWLWNDKRPSGSFLSDFLTFSYQVPALTLTNNSGILPENYTTGWYHVMIQLNTAATSKICIGSDAACATFELNYGTDRDANLYLGLDVASFRELKLYPYIRPETVFRNDFNVTQVDPKQENLIFYYPLTGKESDLYNQNMATPNSYRDVNTPIGNIYWETTPDLGLLQCPAGFIQNIDLSDVQISLERASCIKAPYLERAPDTNYVLINPPTGTEVMSISAWIYYRRNVVNGIEFLYLGQDGQMIVFATLSAGSKLIVGVTPNTFTVDIPQERWVHVGYNFDSNNAKVFWFSEEFDSKSSVTQPDISTQMKMSAAPSSGVLLRNVHVVAGKNIATFNWFKDNMEKIAYPYYSLTTFPAVLAFIPGVSISTNNNFYIFVNPVANNAKYSATPATIQPTSEPGIFLTY